MTEPLLLRIEAAAELLSISRADCYREIAAGRLLSVRVSGGQRVPRQAVEAFVADRLAEVAGDRQAIRGLLTRPRKAS